MKYVPNAGEFITTCIENALEKARTHSQDVSFVFNDTYVLVTPNSCKQDIGTIWNLTRRLDQIKKDKGLTI